MPSSSRGARGLLIAAVLGVAVCGGVAGAVVLTKPAAHVAPLATAQPSAEPTTPAPVLVTPSAVPTTVASPTQSTTTSASPSASASASPTTAAVLPTVSDKNGARIEVTGHSCQPSIGADDGAQAAKLGQYCMVYLTVQGDDQVVSPTNLAGAMLSNGHVGYRIDPGTFKAINDARVVQGKLELGEQQYATLTFDVPKSFVPHDLLLKNGDRLRVL